MKPARLHARNTCEAICEPVLLQTPTCGAWRCAFTSIPLKLKRFCFLKNSSLKKNLCSKNFPALKLRVDAVVGDGADTCYSSASLCGSPRALIHAGIMHAGRLWHLSALPCSQAHLSGNGFTYIFYMALPPPPPLLAAPAHVQSG